MSFKIKVNGDTVHEYDDDVRVTGVSLTTSKGEVGRTEIDPSQGEINIVTSFADPTAVNLHDISNVPKNVTEDQVVDAFPAVQPNTTTDSLSGDTTTVNEGVTVQPDVGDVSVPGDELPPPPAEGSEPS